MKRHNILLFIYNSFNDPLFQNILLSYIRDIQTTHPAYSFHVITFEQEDYAIPAERKVALKDELAGLHIHWHPLEFHTGRFLLAKKLWDMCTAIVMVGRLRLLYKTKIIFAFANVSAAYSYLLSRLYRMKLIIYSYEPHSEFMAELGVWSRQSLRYKVLKMLEDKAGREANVVLTGTKYLAEALHRSGIKGTAFRAPTGVDETLFQFNPDARKLVRQNLEINNRKVVLYIGKFGDLYYKEEVIAFFSGLFQKDPSFYFIVVTRYCHAEIRNWFKQYNIPPGAYFVTGNVSDAEVKAFISAADIGISAVPPSPSQKFRSPTKVGEYLMCGLPYITCEGVSEDDVHAREKEVGVVVKAFSAEDAIDSYSCVSHLLNEDKNLIRARCRAIGIAYRSKRKVVQLIDEQLKKLTISLV